MSYIIVRSMYLSDFEKYVEEKIKQGYKPLGGVSVAQDSTRSITYHQALTKL